jgi:OmpA-OmpF porin, OOP family
MRKFRTIGSCAALLAGLAAASCSSWYAGPGIHGTPITARASLAAAEAGIVKQPTTFLQYLTNEYAAFAGELLKLGDLVDTDYFARKSLAAGHGVAVPPEQNASWAIPLETPNGFRTMLAQARTRLLAALDGGARERAPAVAARAQERYDCWTERMEDDWKTAQNGSCRKDFEAAMNQLEAKPAAAAPPPARPAPRPARRPATVIDVYFDFNKSGLTREARQIVQQIADQLKTDSRVTVNIVGKTDLAGTDAYNMALSKRRAEAVQSELAKDGVPASRMHVQWTGKRSPPVPTADGVREPRNRVVEVTLR